MSYTLCSGHKTKRASQIQSYLKSVNDSKSLEKKAHFDKRCFYLNIITNPTDRPSKKLVKT